MFIKNISAFINESTTNDIYYTSINIDNIETTINIILDKYSDTCKYYINCIDNNWCVSFNVGLEQYDAMVQTMFYINLYKDINNNAIITISKEIHDNEQWSAVLRDLLKNLNKK